VVIQGDPQPVGAMAVASERGFVGPHIYILVAGRFLGGDEQYEENVCRPLAAGVPAGIRPIRRHMHHALVILLYPLCTIIKNSNEAVGA
jgi:hypothetical protein